LPWHNTLVWTAITAPVGTLALFALGVGRALRAWRVRPEWLLLVGHWAVLVVVRATPWAPPHDAERLFLPSFAFLALLAGLGAEVLDWLHDHTAEDEKIAFAPLSWENLKLLRDWGTLRAGWLRQEPGRYRWYVIQRRPGFWSEADRRLIESGRAVFRKTIR